MTIDGFVHLLSLTPGEWTRDEPLHRLFITRIRRFAGGRFCCPITALGEERQTARYQRDADRLGLTKEDADTIAVTADGNLTHRLYDPLLRRRIETVTVNRPMAENR